MIFPKRNLFVCVGNIDRSKAGELVYIDLLKQNGFQVGHFWSMDVFDFYVGSAGIEVSAQARFNGSTQVNSPMVSLADRIFSVEDNVTQRLVNYFGAGLDKIIHLNIEDGRSLIVPEQAKSLFEEYRFKLKQYVPERG